MKLKYIILAIVIGIGILMWSAYRDTDIQYASDKYEACVRATYGMSPQSWYFEKGEYPICPNSVAN